MRVFITGATGFIGMNVVRDLVAAGHKPIGLCRAPEKAAALAAAGAEVLQGSVQDKAKLSEIEGFFGWLAMFARLDMPASSEITQRKLDWKPKGPGLIADLQRLEFA